MLQNTFQVITEKPWFSVNQNAEVCNTKTGRILKPYSDRDGYLRYAMGLNGKTKHVAQHRAVAEMFVPNPNPAKFKIVNHKDGIRNNNKPENLEWANEAVNRQFSDAMGNWNVRGERHSQAKLTDKQVIEICEVLNSDRYKVVEIAEMFGASRHTITGIKHGWSWRHIIEEHLNNCPPPRKPKRMKAKFELVRDRIERGEDKETVLSYFTDDLKEQVASFYDTLITDIETEYTAKF